MKDQKPCEECKHILTCACDKCEEAFCCECGLHLDDITLKEIETAKCFEKEEK